ncbi:MAG: FAD-binding oxidoreductase, partial [Rhodospirillaceae bacterium]|nr:FAD-binding oxidoreductase [Rhodospirillaceae bacterium]
LRPASTENLAKAVSIAAQLGYALVPRGSGHSYSGGTVPTNRRSVVVDTAAMDRVLEIDTVNRFVRVQAGCTWATLLDALAPHGLRTPFFGPLSGFRSTIGGALSQRATFFGSAMHGFSDNSVIGQKIVLADGRILDTGRGHDGQPHPQPGGPDLGALFLGDCGAFGIKAEAILRVIEQPGAVVFASFAYPDMAAMLAAQVAIAGGDGIAECFGFDRQAHINLARGGFEFLEGAEIAMDVLRQAGSTRQRIGRLAQLFREGRRTVADLQCSLHICVEGEDEDHAGARLARAGAMALETGGEAIPDTIPRVTRSRPFRPIKALLGPDGERWLPFHGVFRLGDVGDAQEAFAAALARHEAALTDHEMKISLLTVSSGDAIVLEPHLFWPDDLHAFHRHHVTDGQLKRYGDRPERPETRAFAHGLRKELGDVLHQAGAEHLQIGRYYPYEADLDPVRRDLMQAIKRHLDPDGLMAPGVLFAGS